LWRDSLTPLIVLAAVAWFYLNPLVQQLLERVFQFYFGADLPAEPDHLYMSTEQSPFDFVEVDPASLP
jgi:hypothetical protein